MDYELILENIADVLDNYFVDGEVVTEENSLNAVVELINKVQKLEKENERLSEKLDDFVENL